LSEVVAPDKAGRSSGTSSATSLAEHQRVAAADGVMSTWRTGPRRAPLSFISYPLLWCPPMPAANFVLTRRERSDKRHVLRIGRVESDTPIYNLAQLRYAGAVLGADEIHVHIPAGGTRARRRIERQMIEANASGALRCQFD
jgi:hypothetical protein